MEIVFLADVGRYIGGIRPKVSADFLERLLAASCQHNSSATTSRHASRNQSDTAAGAGNHNNLLFEWFQFVLHACRTIPAPDLAVITVMASGLLRRLKKEANAGAHSGHNGP